MEKRLKLKALVQQYSLFSANAKKVWNQVNVRIEQYNLLKKLFFEDRTYGDCPVTIETAISTSAVLTDEEELQYYETYADLIKVKPDVALPAKLG